MKRLTFVLSMMLAMTMASANSFAQARPKEHSKNRVERRESSRNNRNVHQYRDPERQRRPERHAGYDPHRVVVVHHSPAHPARPVRCEAHHVHRGCCPPAPRPHRVHCVGHASGGEVMAGVVAGTVIGAVLGSLAQ